MSDTEQQIREHNERQLWLDAANHLQVARESVEQAQASLSDLGQDDFADHLNMTRNHLFSAESVAYSRTGEEER